MKVSLNNNSINLQAENRKEEVAINDLFSAAAQKVPGGPGAFKTQAIFVQHKNYSYNGKVSFSISFDFEPE